LLGDWFWVAVPLIYAGFAALAVDACLEPGLHGRTKWRIGIVFVISALASLFSWGIVFVSAPLQVSAFMIDGTYPAGTNIAGISWRPEFTEVDIEITNPTSMAYDDLDVVFRPSTPIAAIAQKGNICPNISFDDKNHAAAHFLDIDKSGNKTAVPTILLATDSGYRIRCPHLPENTTISIVVALADVRWVDCSGDLANCPVRIKYDDFSSYWIGLSGGNVYLKRPTSSDITKVDKVSLLSKLAEDPARRC
jgi:hypothetical protein